MEHKEISLILKRNYETASKDNLGYRHCQEFYI